MLAVCLIVFQLIAKEVALHREMYRERYADEYIYMNCRKVLPINTSIIRPQYLLIVKYTHVDPPWISQKHNFLQLLNNGSYLYIDRVYMVLLIHLFFCAVLATVSKS